ncbi:MAG: glycosyltransferase [Flavobacteriaceae bacterium]
MTPSIVHVIPTLENAGAETILSRLVEEFHAQGYRQTIIISKGSKQDFFYERLLPFGSLFVWKSEKKQALTHLKELSNQTVLLGWMYDGIYFSYRLKWQFRFPFSVVWNIRQSNFQSGQIKQKIGLLAFGILSQLLRPKIIYCAHVAKAVHRKFLFFNKKSCVIQNRLAKKNAISPVSQIDLPNEYVLFVGRYDPIKGTDRLLRIATDFLVSHPDFDLVIAGSGWQKENLPLQIQKKVFLLGNVSYVNLLYQNASGYLFTSYFEGYPNVLVEAVCSGCPIVAFQAGDASYILASYPLGDLVNSEKDFLARLKDRIAKLPSKKERITIAKKQKEYFLFERTVKEYHSFIFTP